MKLPQTSRIVATLGGLAALALAVLPAFGVVHWSAEQVIQAGVEATAGVGFVGAVIGHFRKGTAPEPVMLGAAVSALVGSTLATGNIFAWWMPPLDANAIAGIMAAVAVIIGGGAGIAARQSVTPVNPPAR